MIKKLYLFFIFFLFLFIIFKWEYINIKPFNKTIYFNMPYKVVGDISENIYTIDNSKRRIIKFDKDGFIKYLIIGGQKNKNSFFYAEDIVVDEKENLYILNRIPDKGGFYTTSEEILKYSKDGKFIGKIYVFHYKEKETFLIQRGKINKIYYKNGFLKWFILDKNQIINYSYNIYLNKIEQIKKVSFEYASILLYNIFEHNQFEWLITTKKGQIFSLDNVNFNKEELIKSENLNYPYDLAIDNYNFVYFSDILDRSIYRYKFGKIEKLIQDEDLEENGIFYKISVIIGNKDFLYAGINDKILKIDLAENKKDIFNKCQYNNIDFYLINFFWLSIYFVLLNIITFVFSSLLKVIRKNLKLFYNIFLILLVVSLSTFFISKLMFKNFNSRYIDIIEQKCSLMVQFVSNNLNGDILERVNSKEDFLSEDYLKLRNFLQKALNYNSDKWNENYYFAVYKVIDNKLYAYMYLNDEIGVNYPIEGWFEEKDSAPSRAMKGEIVFETDEDQWGSWFYSMGPIKNSKGEIVGLIEIGSDFYIFNLENINLIKRVILDISTILIVLILIFFEFLFLTDIIEKKEARINEFSETYFVRTFNFLFTFAISMSISFIPLIMRDIYVEFINSGNNFIWNLSQEMVIALPLSGEMFLFSLALIIGGLFVNRLGFKKILITGIIFTGSGLFASAIFNNPYLFILARAIVGFGSGLVLISLRSCINCEIDQKKKSLSYSHYYSGALAGLNAGVVIGAFIADQYGYKITFFAAIILLFVAGLFGVKYLIKNNEIKISKGIKNIYSSIFKLLFNLKIISYLVFAIMPTYVAGMFLVYYLPLFAEHINLSISDIGRLFIVNGILIIYLGPFLSNIMKKYISNRTGIFLTSIFWAFTIIYFSLNQNLAGLILTIVFMGIIEGFGVVFQNDYFLGLPVVKQIGEDLSITYFELFAKFAEVIAPIIFGWILLFKDRNGMFIFGIIMILISIFYFLPFIRRIFFKGVKK